MLSGAYWSPFGFRTSRTNMHKAQFSSSAVQCSGSSFSGRNPRGPPNRPAIGVPLAAAAFSICAFFCSTQCLYALTPYVNLRTKLASAGGLGGCGGTFTGIICRITSPTTALLASLLQKETVNTDTTTVSPGTMNRVRPIPVSADTR